jgi:hypothetical protein
MKTLMTLLLTACAVPHEYTIPPGQKFIDGEVRYGYAACPNATSGQRAA